MNVRVSEMSAAEREEHDRGLLTDIEAGHKEVSSKQPPPPSPGRSSDSKTMVFIKEASMALRNAFLTGFIFMGYVASSYYVVELGILSPVYVRWGIVTMGVCSIGLLTWGFYK